MTTGFAKTPPPPYYAVIFTAQRTEGEHGYGQMAQKMMALALEQPGSLGAESARNEDGFGITVSYWQEERHLRAWKEVAEHLLAQKYGKERWYSHYEVRVARVERVYAGPEGR